MRVLRNSTFAIVLAALAFSAHPFQTAGHAQAQTSKPAQAAEEGYTFDNQSPAYALGTGPRIAVHRYVSPYVQRGAFNPFQTLVETDGFQFNWLDKQISSESLAEIDILVVSNAYTKGGANDYNNFGTLDAPSVYSPDEIQIIKTWVEQGGRLLVLADHSPFAGGAIKLAEAFGFVFMTGFAIHKDSFSERVLTDIDFRREGEGKQIGKLSDHPIVNGSTGRPPISHFKTFGGQAIIPAPKASSFLTIPAGFESLLTFRLRQDFNTAARLDASGLSQGATMDFGDGRIAIFGETGAFTSQSQLGAAPFGLSDPEADENADFVLATLRWLVGFKP